MKWNWVVPTTGAEERPNETLGEKKKESIDHINNLN